MLSFTEDTFEQAVIELIENMGYTHIYAPDMNRTDYSRPLLDDVLRDCLVRLNRNLPVMAIDEAILKLNDFDAGSLLQKNIIFMDYGECVGSRVYHSIPVRRYCQPLRKVPR